MPLVDVNKKGPLVFFAVVTFFFSFRIDISQRQ